MMAADLLVVLHLMFILFVVTGGFLALRWPRLIWLHVPCAAWGAVIEFTGWICPLTPLENRLRRDAGGAGYEGGFIDHYVVPVVYPEGLTQAMQVWLGAGGIVVNLVAYGLLLRRRRRRRER
jgi:hypothetical protein